MTIKRIIGGAAAGTAVLALSLGLAACGDSDSSASTAAAGGGGAIAFLLPESKTARYESQDRPLFEAKIKELCPDCEIIYSNADQDANKQQQQAEAALTKGAKVMVLDPVDSAAAAAIAKKAKAAGVPVVSYDRLITGTEIDYYISFDNEKVGELQATSLSEKMAEDGKATGPIVMINGSPTDNNAKLFKAGAKKVFDEKGVTIAAEYDTPDWSPDKAQQEMDQAITKLGKDGFTAVYAANDGTAGGAIAAMKSAGVDPGSRPTTGQDAELAAIQRILAGTQYMTVYKAIKPEAEQAATLAVALVRGEDPSGTATAQVDNGKIQVKSILLEPVAVTKANIKDTVVADGFWTVAQICTPEYADACAAAGLE